MKYHPDRNPGDHQTEEKFKEIQEAYSALSDQQQRAAYDQFGHAGMGAGARGGFNFNDVFGDMAIFLEIYSEDVVAAQDIPKRNAVRSSLQPRIIFRKCSAWNFGSNSHSYANKLR